MQCCKAIKIHSFHSLLTKGKFGVAWFTLLTLQNPHNKHKKIREFGFGCVYICVFGFFLERMGFHKYYWRGTFLYLGEEGLRF